MLTAGWATRRSSGPALTPARTGTNVAEQRLSVGQSVALAPLAADGTRHADHRPTANVAAVARPATRSSFTYTAATGGMRNGAVICHGAERLERTLHDRCERRLLNLERGRLTVAGQTITVSALTLGGGATLTIAYGDTRFGGPGATATTTAGGRTWKERRNVDADGSLANIATSPRINVYAADGRGTLTTPPARLRERDRQDPHLHLHGRDGRDLERRRARRRSDRLERPVHTGAAAGYTTASTGTVAVSGRRSPSPESPSPAPPP